LAEGESLYSLNEALLERLAPDVVVTQALCQVCSVSLSLVQEIVGRIAARQNAQKTAAAAAEAGGGVGSSSSPSSTRPLPTQPKVVSLNPQCLEDVLQDLVVVGEACGLKEEGEAAAADLRARADRAEAIAKEERAKRRAAAAAAAATSDSPLPLPTVGFCEWVEPIFVGGHWTPQIIAMAGGHHPLNPPKMTGGTGAATACGFSRVIEPGSAGVCGVVGANGDDKDDGTPLVVTCGGGAGAGSAAAIAAEEEIRRQAKAGGPELCHGGERPGGASPSFAVTNETVAKLDPDFLVIAPCGLDIPTTLRELSNSGVGRSAWFRGLKAVKQGRCAVVDGNQMFNRPGPRLVDALEFFVGFLHDRPEVIPSDFPWVPFSEEILPPPAVGEEKEGGGGGGEEKAAGGG
jgi:ABC-type Fe3+-hydroxamate transport system substrate-binding protein